MGKKSDEIISIIEKEIKRYDDMSNWLMSEYINGNKSIYDVMKYRLITKILNDILVKAKEV